MTRAHQGVVWPKERGMALAVNRGSHDKSQGACDSLDRDG